MGITIQNWVNIVFSDSDEPLPQIPQRPTKKFQAKSYAIENFPKEVIVCLLSRCSVLEDKIKEKDELLREVAQKIHEANVKTEAWWEKQPWK